MKLITAFVNKEDSKDVRSALVKNKYYVTALSTMGGFLMAGNVTMLIATDDDKVDRCIEIFRECCSQRTEIVPDTAGMGVGLEFAMPVEVTVGGATLFVTNIERFEKL